MMRWLREAYSPAVLLAVWLTAWGFAGGMWLFTRIVPGLHSTQEVRNLLVGGPSAILVLFAAYRTLSRHPISNPTYADWLSRTPWLPADPLPLGRVLLGWQDVIAAVLLVAPAYLIDAERVWIPLQVLVGTYLVVLTGQVATSGQKECTFVALIGIGGMILAMKHPMLYFGIALGVYPALVIGYRRSLPRFTSREPAEPLGDLGWPYQLVGPVAVKNPPTRRDGFAIGLLCGWAVFIVGWYADLDSSTSGRSERLTTFLVPFCVITCSLARLAVYALGHLPPISVFGRIATGRLLIPAYDVVWVAPLAAVAVSLLVPNMLIALGLPSPVAAGVGAAIVAPILLLAGPRRQDWRLTAPVRLSIAFTPTQQPLTRTTNR